MGGDTHLSEAGSILTTPAAVVQHGVRGVDNAISKTLANGHGEVPTTDSSSLPRDSPVGHIIPKIAPTSAQFFVLERADRALHRVILVVERVTNNVVFIYNGALLANGRVQEIRDLLDDHPRTIKVESPDPRALATHFYGEPSILSIEFGDDLLTLRSREPNTCFDLINKIALEETVPVTSITCTDDDLQSVFEYLVR
jgi:hypothetical protein